MIQYYEKGMALRTESNIFFSFHQDITELEIIDSECTFNKMSAFIQSANSLIKVHNTHTNTDTSNTNTNTNTNTNASMTTQPHWKKVCT